jgi:tetratricopeptide (TPR) repeat protein
MTRLLLCFFLLLLLGVGSPARGSTASATNSFDAANALYEEGKFGEAAQAYQALLDSGKRSAALLFNLGNAFFKSGQLGKSIAAYRAAQSLSPRDPDIIANLKFARDQRQGPSLPVNAMTSWIQRLTLNEWATLAATGLWFWILLRILFLVKPALKPTLRGIAATLGILTLILFALLFAAVRAYQPNTVAIVSVSQTDVRNGPLDESPTAFVAHDGAELRVLDQKDTWVQVTTGPGRIGWIPRDKVLLD